METITKDEYLELKSLILHAISLLEVHTQQNTLEWTPTSILAKEFNKNPKTILSYIRNNFEPGSEFKKEGRKIYVHRAVLPVLRGHYG